MESLPEVFFEKTVFLDLSPTDSVCFSFASRRWQSFAKQYAGLIGFALTRLRVSGPEFSLRMWQSIYAQCAESAEMHCLSFDVWARPSRPMTCEWPRFSLRFAGLARHHIECESNPNHRRSIGPLLQDLVDMVQFFDELVSRNRELSNKSQLACALILRGGHFDSRAWIDDWDDGNYTGDDDNPGHERYYINALLIMSDGQFAVLYCEIAEGVSANVSWGATILSAMNKFSLDSLTSLSDLWEPLRSRRLWRRASDGHFYPLSQFKSWYDSNLIGQRLWQESPVDVQADRLDKLLSDDWSMYRTNLRKNKGPFGEHPSESKASTGIQEIPLADNAAVQGQVDNREAAVIQLL